MTGPLVVRLPTRAQYLRGWLRWTWNCLRGDWPGLCAGGCGAAEQECFECGCVHCPQCFRRL